MIVGINLFQYLGMQFSLEVPSAKRLRDAFRR
jgi:hypothetical protein